MRHYEIVFMVHPDQSTQVPDMIERYAKIITNGQGTVHRKEDCGRRALEYTINNSHKAHFVLFNIECNSETLNELKESVRFNDAIIRNLIIKKDAPVTGPSLLLKK